MPGLVYYQSAPGSSASRPCRSTCSRHPSGLRIPGPFYRPGRLRLQLLLLPATSSQAPHSGSVLPEPLCGSVGVPGLEPGTSSLSAKRSNRLSYTPRCLIGPRYDCTAHPGPISNRGFHGADSATSAYSADFLVVSEGDADAATNVAEMLYSTAESMDSARQQDHVHHSDDGRERCTWPSEASS
jgi:hypothetical protein